MLALSCCLRRLLWTVSVAVMSRIGRYLLSEVAALAVSVAAMSRIGH